MMNIVTKWRFSQKWDCRWKLAIHYDFVKRKDVFLKKSIQALFF